MSDDAGLTVRDDTSAHRFVLDLDGAEAELIYRRNGKRLVLIHTEVPERLGGRGIGGLLVEKALEQAREEDLTIVPLCPYARAWLERHPDEAATVAIDWSDADDSGSGSSGGSRSVHG